MFQKLFDKLDVPMIVGGTGLYIKAAISNYEFDAPKRDYSFEEDYAYSSIACESNKVDEVIDRIKSRIEDLKENGISLDDCEKVSNEITDILDKEDYIKEQYFLEVSSTRC